MKRTVLRMLDEAARNFPNDPYALRRTDSGYTPLSFSSARERVREFAAWLMAGGYSPGDRFAVLAEGSPEWICGEFGLVAAGIISVPLSIKLLSEELPFRLNHSGARGILVTHNQLEKLLASFPSLENKALRIVFLDGDLDWAREKARAAGLDPQQIEGLAEAQAAGRALLADPASGRAAALDARIAATEESDVVTISYTSGTTGNPKGIMLTHLNYWTNCLDAKALFEDPMHFSTLLVLPVDHSFAHTVGLYTALVCGIALYFVDSRGGGMATLRNIPINLKEAEPIFLLTVPSLSGNFMKKIVAGIEEKGGLIEKIFKAGIAAGIAWNGDGFHAPSAAVRAKAFIPYRLAKALIFGKITRMVFGRNIRFMVGGGALLDVKQQEFFAAFGVPVFQGYGLTEAAPVISSNTPSRHKFGTSGILAPSLICTIMKDDGTEAAPGENGEITIQGGNVMKGYYLNPAATAETLRDGRLWTGDLGHIDEDGFLVVVGRAKALLIAEDGEKYSPEEIEEAVTMSTDVIDQVMVWCDHRKYSCALVALDSSKVERLVKAGGIRDAQGLAEALKEEFTRFRNDPAAKKVQHNWIPAAFQIVPGGFGEKDGTINSTMKLVRHRVVELHRDLIEYSYTAEGSKTVNPRNVESLRAMFKLP